METTKDRVVFNSLNPKPVKTKTFKQPSLTAPDQSLSIRQIIQGHTRGLNTEKRVDVIYEEDDMPTQGINPKTLDFVDIQVLNQQSKEVINQANNATWHQADPDNRMYLQIEKYKIAMPRYYKQKIYDDWQRKLIAKHLIRKQDKAFDRLTEKEKFAYLEKDHKLRITLTNRNKNGNDKRQGSI